MRIDSPSLVGTTTITGSTVVTGSVTPGLDASYDFGATSKRWNNIYAVNISGSLTGSNVTAGQVVVAGTRGVLSGTNNLYWDNTNIRLGVGTGAPTQALDVRGSTGSDVIALVKNDGAGRAAILLDSGGSSDSAVRFLSAGSLKWSILNTPNDLGFYSYSTSTYPLFIAGTTGNIGVNTTTTSGAKLTVSGSSTSSMPTMVVREGVATPTAGVGILNVQNSAGTSILFVTGSGNVGVGTNSVQEKLQVYGDLKVGLTTPGAFITLGDEGVTTKNNGIYRPASSNTVTIGAYSVATINVSPATLGNQTERMRIESTGNVGIGTNSYSARLHVSGSSTANTPTMVVREGVVSPTGGAGTFDVQNSAGTSILFVTGSGLVGIGTTIPVQNGTGLTIYQSSNSQLWLQNSSGYSRLVANSTDLYIDSNVAGSAGNIIFRRGSGTTESARIDSSGNVGIGTNSMGDKLAVNGSLSVTGSLQPGTSNSYTLGSSTKLWSTVYATNLSGSLTKLSDGTSYLIAGTNVTITTGSSGAVTIAASAAAGTLSGAGTTNYVPKYTASTTLGNSNIYDDGSNVGIGSATPGEKLDVAGYVRAASGFLVPLTNAGYGFHPGRASSTTGATIGASSGTSSNYNGLFLESNAFTGSQANTSLPTWRALLGGGSLEWATDSFSIGRVAAGGTFGTPTTLFTINSSGNTGIGTTATNGNMLSVNGSAAISGSVLPGTTLTHDLGSSTKYWRDVYARSGSYTGDVTISGNLTVAGTQTIVNSETVNIKDNIILLNSTASPQQYGGIYVADTTANTTGSLRWNSSTDKWEAGLAGSEVALPTGTGTTSYVTRWTGTNTLGTGVIYDDAVSVGVGVGANVAGGSGNTWIEGRLQIGVPANSASIFMQYGTAGTYAGAKFVHSSTNAAGAADFTDFRMRPAYGSGVASGTDVNVIRFNNTYARNFPDVLLVPSGGYAAVGVVPSPSAQFTVSGSSTSSVPTMIVKQGVSSPTGGAGVLDVQNSAGTSILFVTGSGRVGVGTITPQAAFHVVNGTVPNAANLYIGYAGSNNYYDANAHYYRDGAGNLRTTINSSGITPGTNGTQDLGSSSFLWRNVYATSFSGSLTGSNVTAGQVVVAGTGGVLSGSNNFWWDNTNRRVGIGTSNPGTSLDVVNAGAVQFRAYNTAGGSDARFEARNTTGEAYFGIDNVGAYVYTGTSIPIKFTTSGSERVRIDSSGNVGINTTSMTLKLEVSGSDAKIHDVRIGRGPGSSVSNTVVGNVALNANVSGTGNTAIGYYALNVSTASSNTAVGDGAFGSVTSGAEVTGIGRYAGVYQLGSYNTAIGSRALFGVSGQSTASNNTAVGYQAGQAVTTGGSNFFGGYQAGYLNSVGTNNVHIGSLAGYSSTSGSYNTFLGNSAGYNNTTASGNTFLGHQSGYANTTAASLTYVGANAGIYQTGASNTALGAAALFGVGGQSTAANNTSIGYQAGYSITTGGSNFFGGYQAGYVQSVATNNVLIGYQAGVAVTSGSNNVFLGYQPGFGVTTGAQNILIGTIAGYRVTTGNYNTHVGGNAGVYNSASNNTTLGYQALAGSDGSSTGGSNVAIGFQAGDSVTTGANNVIIGSGADLAGATDSNSIVIGSGSLGRGSNTTVIGNASTSLTLVPSGSFSLAGTATGTNSVSMGLSNVASGNYSFAAGNGNTASSTAAVAIGNSNTASTSLYPVAIGQANTSTGVVSVAIGNFNTATGDNSFVTGRSGKSYLWGQRSHSAHYFAAVGDAQFSSLVARNSTTNATVTELFLDGLSLRAVIPSSTTWVAEIEVVARASTGTSHACFKRRCLISRDGSNNTALVGSVQVIGSDIGSNVGSPPSGWDVTVSADDTNESLKIAVTGAVSTNIRWVARIDLVEVGY
jgi:hypothetical protein